MNYIAATFRRALAARTPRFAVLTLILAVLGLGCADSGKKSAEFARTHVQDLAKTAAEDVRQVRSGLPSGGQELDKLLPAGELEAAAAREALETARSKNADLRVAKSTFFAVVAPSGVIVRNDREQDRMVGKNLFESFPGARLAPGTAYGETRGSMPEASEVRGRSDAQWVAVAAIGAAAAPRAFYATGWSWSSYAYRLQNSLLSTLRGALVEHQKMPLIYVFVAVEREVYAVAEAPDVNIKAVRDLGLTDKLRGKEPFAEALELTGRSFGLAAVLVPELGDKVAIVVLRSEV